MPQLKQGYEFTSFCRTCIPQAIADGLGTDASETPLPLAILSKQVEQMAKDRGEALRLAAAESEVIKALGQTAGTALIRPAEL